MNIFPLTGPLQFKEPLTDRVMQMNVTMSKATVAVKIIFDRYVGDIGTIVGFNIFKYREHLAEGLVSSFFFELHPNLIILIILSYYSFQSKWKV